jgi:hypothetical protein
MNISYPWSSVARWAMKTLRGFSTRVSGIPRNDRCPGQSPSRDNLFHRREWGCLFIPPNGTRIEGVSDREGIPPHYIIEKSVLNLSGNFTEQNFSCQPELLPISNWVISCCDTKPGEGVHPPLRFSEAGYRYTSSSATRSRTISCS